MFNDFFIGSGGNFSLPEVFKGLYRPFEVNFHWTDSPFDMQTPLETIFLNCEQQFGTELESYQLTWRYLRFVFASIWFGKLLNIISKHDFKQSFYVKQSNYG